MIRSRSAVVFDGKDDIYICDRAPTTQKQSVAIEAWVRPTAAEGYGTIVQLGGGGGLAIAQQAGGVWGVLNGKATVGWAKLRPEEWHHVALVVDGGKSTLYVDGQSSGSINAEPWGWGSGDPLVIGGDGQSKHFAGAVDEVRVLDFAPGTFDARMLLINGGQFNPRSPASSPARNVTGAKEQPPGIDVIEIEFNEQPVEQGMTFARDTVKPTSVEFKGTRHAAWVAEKSATADMPWMRSWLFTVTDDRFKNGGRPAVDVELTYHLPAWSGVAVRADTKSGARKIGDGWGDTKEWRTARFSLDDAFFGGRSHGGADALARGAFDLRIDGANAGLYLRRVRLVGYDPKENIQWDRMLKVREVSADTPGGVFAFRRGDNTLNLTLQNIAHVPRPLRLEATVTGYDDRVMHREEQTVTLQGDSMTTLPLRLATHAWPLGPYDTRIALYLDNTPHPVYERTVRFGLITEAVLSKARPQDYLFGLDAGNTSIVRTGDDVALAYYDLMGVDILRHLDGPETVEGIGRSLARLAERNVQAMLMIDPPKERDARQRAATLAKKEQLLSEVAQRYAGRGPGRIRFYELGNEPDLTFFYPGPIEEYVQSFHAMSDAIKRGATSAGLDRGDTVVMNGGLCFVGEDGNRRAREFVRLVDPERIDAFAYHGHGPGVEAERDALLRMRQTAAEYGKGGLPAIETESGYSGESRSGMLEQARTAVEKQVYAMSEALPTLFYFRLFMEGDDGYGMTQRRVEPKPSVLSYRHLVERLRRHAFVRHLDVPANGGEGGVLAYLFEERDDAGRPTGRKTVVAWSTRPTRIDLTIHLAPAGGTVKEAQLIDLFGNRSPATPVSSNAVRMPVGVDPSYVTWLTDGDSDAVGVSTQVLQIDTAQPLLTGATNTVPLRVYNPGASALTGELRVRPHARVGIEVADAVRPLTVRSGEAVEVPVSLTLDPAGAPLEMPRWWHVFLDADAAALSPQQLAAVPDTLASRSGGLAQRRSVWTTTRRVDFGELAGGVAERRPAVAYAVIDSPTDTKWPVAASADWWMAWYVNGERIYDTLATGNRHGSLADHVFDMPLKKGRNVIAVSVLSGSQGWSIELGGPKERAIAWNGIDPDRIEATLQIDPGSVIAEASASLVLQSAVQPLFDVDPAVPSGWWTLEPLTVLGHSHLENPNMAHPDQSRWYRGDGDVSAIVWLRDGGNALHLAVAVRDDRFHPASSRSEISDHDHLRVALSDQTGQVVRTLALAMVGNTVSVEDPSRLAGATRVEPRLVAPDGQEYTLYYVELPEPPGPSDPFRMQLTVGDRDGGPFKQALRLSPSEDVKAWLELIRR